MNYQRLFELSIVHDYYRDKICPDITIEPTPECREILSGHRLMVKKKVNGISLITPVLPGGKSSIELADNLSFTFLLKIKNSKLLDFTHIDPKFIRTPIGCDVYAFSNAKNTQVGVSNLESTLISGRDLKLSQGQNILGIVKIYNNSSLPKQLTHFSEYIISLQSKKHYWYYYLIAEEKMNGDFFLIEDLESDKEQKIQFTEIEFPHSDEDYLHSFFGSLFPSQRLLHLFKSDKEVACQEEGRQNIQLLIQNIKGGRSVWIDHLPNPPNRTGIQVVNTLKST